MRTVAFWLDFRAGVGGHGWGDARSPAGWLESSCPLSHTIDALLCDCRVPGRSALRAARHFRSDPFFAFSTLWGVGETRSTTPGFRMVARYTQSAGIHADARTDFRLTGRWLHFITHEEYATWERLGLIFLASRRAEFREPGR